nr:ATP Binding Protein [Bacillus subtilis subsp. subtilis str. 168]
MQIEMKDIHKTFGKNQVLSGVSFQLMPGEVHALMGENGAGKSRLMNILTGLHKADKGQISINGNETYFSNPKEAEQHGIAFIHQELNIWPEMTVLENLFIGKEISSKLGVLQTRKMKALAKEQFDKLSVSLSLDQEAGECSVGQQQMIEIAKALMTNAEVIIMDEPTAALTEREISKLFEVITALKKNGVSIVYISHRMEEIFAICDRITIMRDGKTVDTTNISETDFDEVVKKMVGRELTERYPKRTPSLGDKVFEVKNASVKGSFEDVSFYVRSGEIVGVSGLMGAGRTEMMRALFGVDRLDTGEIWIAGKKTAIKNPQEAVKKVSALLQRIARMKGSCSTASPETHARHLSGGKPGKKVVIAKWIGIGPKVLILDEPTRGVDVGAKREIYTLMNELTERGVAIIMVSSELPEILGMSDRIIVVHEGRISGEIHAREATQERIMTLATGGR